jgi:hypothetical protein
MARTHLQDLESQTAGTHIADSVAGYADQALSEPEISEVRTAVCVVDVRVVVTSLEVVHGGRV